MEGVERFESEVEVNKERLVAGYKYNRKYLLSAWENSAESVLEYQVR